MGGTSSFPRPASGRRQSHAPSVRSLTTSSISPHDFFREQSFMDQHPWVRNLLPLFVCVCLFAILFGYSFLGAAIFESLEKGNEKVELEKFNKTKEAFREWILEFAEKVRNDNYFDVNRRKNYTDLINKTVSEYEEELRHKVCEIKLDLAGRPRWTYYGSLFFAGSVITTIGYGHIAPVTTAGRVFCMAYAIFGISLLLLVLASIGSLLARGATLTYRMLHDKIGAVTIGKKKKKPEEDPRNEVYTRQNGELLAAQDQHREKVIDDIWGTIRFDKNGKMIMPDDPSSGSPSSSQTNGDPLSRKDSKDTSKLRVNFADGKSRHDLEDDSRVIIPQGMYLPPPPTHTQHAPTERVEIEHSIGFGIMDEDDDEEVNVPLHVVLVLATIYIVLLAAILLLWEDQWDFFDALYFSFVTLTTIGFGDLVPQHQKNLLACTFLIILGMAIISMCIALAQDLIMRKIAWLSQKVGVALLRSSKKDGE